MATLRLAVNNRWQATAGLLMAPAKTARVVGPALSASGACSQSRSLHQQADQTAFHQASSSPRAPMPGRRTKALNQRTAGMRALPTQTAQTGMQRRAQYSTASTPAPEPTVHSAFETATGTWQYVVADPSTMDAVIIDPVLDFDPATQVITTKTADSLLAMVKEKGYRIVRLLETHAHADHLSSSHYLQKHLAQQQGYRPPVCIGKRIPQVQTLFGKRYGIAAKEYDGIFDKFFEDDEEFDIGNLKAKAIHLPGHTPDHLGYKIGDNVFCGDSVFHADIGTARCDFPGGSVNDLWNSSRKLFALPDNVKIWTGHDYPPAGRTEPVPYMTVKDHKAQNKHLKDGISEAEFVALRKERDAILGEPRLLHQSLQVNIRAGNLPEPTSFGQRLLHLPLKLKGLEW